MPLLNNTGSGLDVLASGSSVSVWFIGVLVFIGVILIAYLLWKGFREFLIGSVVSVFLLVVFFFSRWVASSYGSGNDKPLGWYVGVLIFIVVSYFIGRFVGGLKFFRDFEKKHF